MEDEFQEFEGEGIDVDYEFDAPRFCDFTRSETYWEAEEAEQWFHSAESYPPSPFVLKFGWEDATSTEIVNGSTQNGNGKSLNIIDDDSAHCVEPKVLAVDDDSRGLELHNHANQDTLEVKTKPLSKSTRSSSTLMKPTASYLAKQKNFHTARFFRRFQSQNSSPIDGQATKRQKLEAGYLGKASHLKHGAHFTHKTPKKVDLTDMKLSYKVTIPRQPELETARRAQRHKSRINSESIGDTTLSSHMFRARPINRKILEASSVPFLKKKASQLPEFHVFHLRASEKAMQHTSSNAGGIIGCNSIPNCETRDLTRPNSIDASRQQKCRVVNKLRGSPDDKRPSRKGERGVFQNIRQEDLFSVELKFINDKNFPNEPPTELFSKLSLASEPKQTTKYQLKELPVLQGLKENRPGFQSMNLVKEGMQRLWEKQCQCLNYDMYKLHQNVPAQFCGSS